MNISRSRLHFPSPALIVSFQINGYVTDYTSLDGISFGAGE